MKYLKFGALMFLFSGLLSFHSVAAAGEPTEQLRGTINKFLTILTNTPVAELQATGLPQSARKLVFARFDFSEMTKRSLGSHWKSLELKEQKEFVDALTERLLFLYGRSVRSSASAKIQYNAETQNGDLANVQTKVLSDGDELPIDYQMHDVNGQWTVYDVVIDHVSLVNNYRAQFDRVIAKSSVQELLKKMKEPNQS
jgi:phospholipid transport system substrate-binding protein